MLTIEKRIAAFVKLGELLRSYDVSTLQKKNVQLGELAKVIEESHLENPWFIPDYVRSAILSIGNSLDQNKIQKWLQGYNFTNINESKKVGVVMAGNIPLVGFHDFLCILISGHQFLGKLASDDQKLLPAITDILENIEPGFISQIEFTDGKLEDFDAIIATGSNNSARYFEYYFGKYPHIIRKNRNGVAIISGNETKEELTELGKDLFLYFGMGCRSVSKMYIPKGYKLDFLFEALEAYKYVSDHFKYNNNYEYYKSIYLINSIPHFDNGFLLITKNTAYSSPPSVLYYEAYDDISILENRLNMDKEQIQCVVSSVEKIEKSIPFGQAQHPELWDYADGVDTLKFLINIRQ